MKVCPDCLKSVRFIAFIIKDGRHDTLNQCRGCEKTLYGSELVEKENDAPLEIKIEPEVKQDWGEMPTLEEHQ